MANNAGPGVGFEFPSFEVSWMKRDLLLFANTIGATFPDELHFLYVSLSSQMVAIGLDCSFVLALDMPSASLPSGYKQRRLSNAPSPSRNSILPSLPSPPTPSSSPSSTPTKM